MRPDMSWCSVLEHHARRTPAKTMAVHGDRAVSYQEMQEWTAALAGGFAARGVGAGDVVALLSYNNLEFLATIFAVNHLGAIAMPVNWRLAAPEFRFIVEHSGARALVCHPELVGLADEATKDLDDDLARLVIGGDDLTTGGVPPRGGFADALAPGGVPQWERFADLATTPAPPRVAAAADDIHRLMYTSGTTGRPKGVM